MEFVYHALIRSDPATFFSKVTTPVGEYLSLKHVFKTFFGLRIHRVVEPCTSFCCFVSKRTLGVTCCGSGSLLSIELLGYFLLFSACLGFVLPHKQPSYFHKWIHCLIFAMARHSSRNKLKKRATRCRSVPATSIGTSPPCEPLFLK